MGGVIGINLISAVGVIMKMDIRVATLEDVQIVAKLAIQMWKSHTIEELAREFYDYISKEKGIVFYCSGRCRRSWFRTMWIKT